MNTTQIKHDSKNPNVVVGIATLFTNNVCTGMTLEDATYLVDKVLELLGVTESSRDFQRFIAYAMYIYVKSNYRSFNGVPQQMHHLTTSQVFCILLIGFERQDEFNVALKKGSLMEVVEQWSWGEDSPSETLLFRFISFFRVIESSLGFPENVSIDLSGFPFKNFYKILNNSVVLPSPFALRGEFEVIEILEELMHENLVKKHLPDNQRVEFYKVLLSKALAVDTQEEEEMIEDLNLRNFPTISVEQYLQLVTEHNKYLDSAP